MTQKIYKDYLNIIETWICNDGEYVAVFHLNDGNTLEIDARELFAYEGGYDNLEYATIDYSNLPKEKKKYNQHLFIVPFDNIVSLELRTNEDSNVEGRKDLILKLRGIRIEDMELTVRTFNCLHFRGIHTLEDLLRWNLSELSKIRSFGKKSLNEIENLVAERGYCLGTLAPIWYNYRGFARMSNGASSRKIDYYKELNEFIKTENEKIIKKEMEGTL